MKLLKLGMICGALLLAACGDDDATPGPAGPPGAQGPAGEPGTGGAAGESINGITPARGFLGRTIRVTISGDNTNWSAAPEVTVDDPEIAIRDVLVASPTGLVLTVEIKDAATPGIKTFTVGGQKYAGFQVEFPAAVGELLGDPAQGSVLLAEFKNRDFENPFDDSKVGDGLFQEIQYVGMAVHTSAPGTGAVVDTVTTSSMYAFLLTDVDVTPGDLEVELESRAGTLYRTGKVATIAARSPEEVVVGGTNASIPISAPFKSVPLKITYPASATGALLNLSVNSGGQQGLQLFSLGASGKWTDSGSGSFVRPNADFTNYMVAVDFSGESGYTAQLTTAATPFEGAAMDTSNSTPETALAVGPTGPYLAELPSPDDADWFKFTLGASNSTLTLTTAGLEVNEDGSPLDTIIDVFAAADLDTPIATSSDNDYDEQLTTNPLPAGEYYFRVTNNPDFASPGASAYAFMLTVTAP